jgi:hypothetical protein
LHNLFFLEVLLSLLTFGSWPYVGLVSCQGKYMIVLFNLVVSIQIC